MPASTWLVTPEAASGPGMAEGSCCAGSGCLVCLVTGQVLFASGVRGSYTRARWGVGCCAQSVGGGGSVTLTGLRMDLAVIVRSRRRGGRCHLHRSSRRAGLRRTPAVILAALPEVQHLDPTILIPCHLGSACGAECRIPTRITTVRRRSSDLHTAWTEPDQCPDLAL
jgi:hypothetical protein